MLGIAVGSLLQPQFGAAGVTAFGAVGLPLLLGGGLLAVLTFERAEATDNIPLPRLGKVATVAPLAVAAVVCYGLF